MQHARGDFCLFLASKELYWATVNKEQLNLLKVCKIRSNLFGDSKKTSKQKSWVIDCCISVALNLKWNQPRLGPKGQETLISILPLSEGPPVRARPPCSPTELVGRKQAVEGCGHRAFQGVQKTEEELEDFLSVKQRNKLSSQGQHCSSPYQQKHLFWPATLCLRSWIFPLWGSVTLLSSLELVFTPLTFRGRGGGGGRQTWLLGPCQTRERGWPWIN